MVLATTKKIMDTLNLWEKLMSAGYKMLIPVFLIQILHWRKFSVFSQILAFSQTHHWKEAIQPWAHLASILISVSNDIGIMLLFPWLVWTFLIFVIPPWRDLVELNWGRSLSYILGWLVNSSIWWWIYYTVEIIIQPASSLLPIASYSWGLYTPAFVLIVVQSFLFLIIGKTREE